MSLGTNRRTSVYTEESQQKCPFVCNITKRCWFSPLICLFSSSRSPPHRTQKRPTVVKLNIRAVRPGCGTTVSDRISPLSRQDLPLRTYKTMPTGEEWRETCSRLVWVDTLVRDLGFYQQRAAYYVHNISKLLLMDFVTFCEIPSCYLVQLFIVSRFLVCEVNSKSHVPMTDQQQRLQVSGSIQFKLTYKRCRKLFVTSNGFNAGWLENIPA